MKTLSTPTRIDATFTQLKSNGQMAFMPFITAGDPDISATCGLIEELARQKVDLIEVGFPYSDPIADGPVIQASYTRALEKHLHVRDIFAGIGSLKTEELPPLVAMVSYALVFRNGPQTFIEQARQAGFSGLIIPDLPADEADEMAELANSRNLNLVQLIAPTTTPERVRRILRTAGGFLYCISAAGTTGVRNELPAELNEQLKWLKTQTELPLAVGFGISTPEQVAGLRGLADGVIVGSRIVRQMEELANADADREQVLAGIGQFAASMVEATHSAKA